MKKTFKGALALAFSIVTILATMIMVSALGAPKAKVSSVTYNSVTISWAKVSDADYYEVQRSTDGKKWTNLSTSVKSTSYKDSKSLTTGKTYKYRVRAAEKRLFKTNYSSWSSAVSAKPVPAKVTGLKVSSKAYSSVKLTWTKVAGASGYQVQYYTGGKWKTFKTTTSNSMTVTGLTLGKTYNFRVRAYKTVSKKPVYGAFSATLKAGPVLPAPANLVLTQVTTSSVKLAWDGVKGAKTYEVYNGATKKWVNAKTAKTLTIKSLKAGTKYSFKVRACSGSYDGPESAARSFTTIPYKPSGVKGSSTATSITFSWNKTKGATKYQPSYYNPATKKWVTLAETTSTSVSVNNLTSGTKYPVRVRAYITNSNVKGISAKAYTAYSTAVAVYTLPVAPKTVKLTGVTTSSLTVNWSAATGATGYEYYNPATEEWVNAGTARTATIEGLNPGTKYTFKVRTLTNTNKSADSKAYSFITTPAAPTDLGKNIKNINGLILSDSTADSITVSWSAVNGAAGYLVQYSQDGSTWTSNGNTTLTTATINGLQARTNYKVRVRAFVKNSNVSGISATTYSSPVITEINTLSNATTNISATSKTTKQIQLTWDEVSGARYIVEKFEIATVTGAWSVYDFNSNRWVSYDNIDENCVIVTDEVSLVDAGTEKRSEIYRVRIVDENNYISVPSAAATGTTADISLTLDAYAATFEWPAVSGAASYKIYNRYPYTLELGQISVDKLTYNSSKNTYKGTFYFAPNTIHSIIICPIDSNNITMGGLVISTFKTGDVPTDTSDAAKNSQLLYLAQAINNTKAYKAPITVKNDAEISYSINKLTLKLGLYEKECNSPEEVAEYFSSLGDDEAATVSSKDTYTLNQSFVNGTGVNSSGKTERLLNYIEPSTNKQLYAKLHNGLLSNSAWKNGFSSVKTTKNADGSHTIEATIKKETNSSPYHNGFVATFSAADLGMADGFEMSEIIVGPSTLKATIAPDGYLKTYEIKSPYSSTVKANITGDSGDFLGKMIKMSMTMGGSTDYSYTVTK